MWNVGAFVRGKLRGASVREDDPVLGQFQSAMLGFAILGTIALVLGVAHLLYAPVLACIVAVLAALGMLRLVHLRAWTLRAPTRSDVPMIACAAFLVANLPRALLPILEHDENVYHLLLPKLYLASHALVLFPWSLGANMPHLVDLSYVFPAAMGGFTAAKVFAYGFTAWTLVGLAPFGRVMLGSIGPGVLAVLYLSGRLVQWHLGLTYVEPAIGALVLCALQCVWQYLERGDGEALAMLGIVLGAACASKYTVWPFAAVVFAICALVRPPTGRKLAALSVAVALCALLVAPWLVKNAVATGNPIYPNAQRLFGGTHWSTIQDVQFQHEMGYGRGADKDVRAYLRLPLRLVIDPYTGTLGSASFSAGVMLLLFASMVLPWRRGEFRTILRLLSIAAFVFWCLGSKQSRYLVPFIPVMVVTAGTAFVPLRRFRGALASVTIAVAVAALVQMKLQPYPTEPLADAFTVSRDELLSRNLCWDLAQFLNRTVPAEGRVLAFWENRLYFLDRPFLADSSYGAPTSLAALREAGDAHRFAVDLAAQGVTHVVVNPYFYKTYMENGFLYNLIDQVYYPVERMKADDALFDRFLSTELTPVPCDEGWAVFRLNAHAAESAR